MYRTLSLVERNQMENQEEFQPIQEKLMQEQQIIECLTRLGEELETLQIQQPLRVLMIGGAYMVTQIKNRERTRDVDVLAYIDRGTEDYQKLLIVASFVSVDMDVDKTWFSDSIGNLMQAVGKVPNGQLWLRQGLLEVHIPESQYVLALKLLAAGRVKDIGDIKALFQIFQIKTRGQTEKLLRKYFSKRALEAYAPEINQTFEALARAGFLDENSL